MDSRFYLWTLLLISSLVLAKGQLKIPLEISQWDKQLNNDIGNLFRILDDLNRSIKCYNIIAFTGNFYLRPSLEQRLMEHFSVPIYTVGARRGSLNHRYPKANNMVIVLFSGLEDPTLAALNDQKLSDFNNFLGFLYVSPREDNRLLTMAEMEEFFTWCYERQFYRVFLFFNGESEFEAWSYYYLNNLTVTRYTKGISFENVIRRQGHRFLVQAANNPPEIFLYNSSVEANVIGGGNMSLSGPVGFLMVEFMRYLNATMEVLPIPHKQNVNYNTPKVASNRRVDLVANLVANDSFQFSPIVSRSQMCLLVPRRRSIPYSRYFDMVMSAGYHWIYFLFLIFVCAVKYVAHRRRSLVNSFLSSLRWSLGIPLPGGQLDRLPLADKIIEVYCLLLVGILISTFGSLLSSALTTGIYYPPITDVESMRASGLRILTSDTETLQAFKDDEMPSSLADLVDIVDGLTLFKYSIAQNDSHVNVIQTSKLRHIRPYEEHMKNKRFDITGPELCSGERHLRLPISPKSPLLVIFRKYYHQVFESGLQQKWERMAFQDFRNFAGLPNLPRETERKFKPLTLSFYFLFIRIYIGGMLLSTLVFVIEFFYKRYFG